MGFTQVRTTNRSPGLAFSLVTSLGGVVSCFVGDTAPVTTFSSACPVAVLPDESVAVNVIRVFPSGRTAGASFFTGRLPSTLSLACAAWRNLCTWGSSRDSVWAPFDDTSCGCGTFSAGFVVSTTLTGNEAVAVLPRASFAEHVTVVVPRGKVDPVAGEQLTSTGPLTRSTAIGGVYAAREPPGPSASTIGPTGTWLKTGAVVSRTLTRNVALALFPLPSVAVQVTVVVAIGKTAPGPACTSA